MMSFINTNKVTGFLINLVIILFTLSCGRVHSNFEEIEFSDSGHTGKNTRFADTSSIFVAISSMTSPKETYVYYNDLINYFSEKTGKTVKLTQRKTYFETNKLIKKSEVNLAFICTGAYVESRNDHSSRLLVVPVIHGKPTYRAYIITNKNSGIEKFSDLRGRSFAFTDPLSNTGYLFPQKRISEYDNHPGDFFSKTVFTYAHDLSIELINKNVVSGASVDGLIFDYFQETFPGKVNEIKIIEKSESFGMPPVVVPANTSNYLFTAYQNVFKEMHKDAKGKAILDKLHIDSFIVVGDSIYQSAIKLKTYIDEAD